jgi:predicted ATPase
MSNAVNHTAPGLVGREEDFQYLLQAYENTKENYDGQLQQLVVIRGNSGTGKTSLARAVIDNVVHDSGFFLTGKFELTALQKPYAVFIMAFDQFTDELLSRRESSCELENRTTEIRKVIQDAVGREGKLLTDMIPSLERLIGKQESICEVRASEALNRFQFIFCKFCVAISTIVPLVLFFDDLQWSDTASLNLVLALLQSKEADSGKSSLLVIGTFRDEGIDNDPGLSTGVLPEMPLLRFLKHVDALSAQGALNQIDISLQSLEEASMIDLVARFLEATNEDLTYSGLARIIDSKSGGNPHQAVQLLHLLVNQGHLRRDRQHKNQWIWDEQSILEAINSVDTIDEMVHRKMMSLPQLGQHVLQLASCIGDTVDFCALSTILDQTPVKDIELSLLAASREGFLVLDRQLGLYRFSHDRIRQVVLSSIDDKDELSFDIGYKLWTRSPPHFLSTKLFVVTNLLNLGLSKLNDQSERYKAAKYNLEAGVQSASLAAFADACKYLRAGIKFMEGGNYWAEEYELALSLFSAAADAELGNQSFDRVSELAATVFDHARTSRDSLVAYRAKINSLGQTGHVTDATAVGFEVLQRLGEPMPNKATKIATILDSIKTRLLLRWHSNEELLSRTASEDEEKVAAIQILITLVPYMYRSGSSNAQLVNTRLVRLCLKHMHKHSASGIVTYGSMICINESSLGHRLGDLALSIVEKHRAREWIPRVHVQFYIFIHHWKRPLKESIEFLQNAYVIGMQLGDVEYAILALSFKCFHSFYCGMPLAQLEECLIDASHRMQIYNHHSSLHRTNALLQYIHNLTGRARNPKILSGDFVKLHDPAVKVDDKTIPYAHHVYGLDLAFMFNDYELAQQHVEHRRNLEFAPLGSYISVVVRFKEALICTSRARLTIDVKKNIRNASTVLKLMRRWARHCKENFLHKKQLVEAELLSLKKPRQSSSRLILTLYNQSIEGALREEFTQEAALACELCGDYLNRQGERVQAATFLRKAQDLYLNWGASEKVAHLCQRNGGCQELQNATLIHTIAQRVRSPEKKIER